jgi:phage gp45-like
MSQHMSETVMELRGTAMRGLVQRVDDSGPMQVVDVLTHDGMLRTGIEVYQFAGLATAPVAAGAVVQLAAIGADPGDLIALPPVYPAARFGGLAPGEAVLYNLTDGSRVAIRQGGTIEILAATEVKISVPSVVITGNVTLNGTLTATGDVVAGGISLTQHLHASVQPGAGESGPPVPGT